MPMRTAGSLPHAHEDDIVLLGVDDRVRRCGRDSRMLGRADLDGSLDPAPVQGDRSKTAGRGSSGVVLGQQRGVDRLGEIGASGTRPLDLPVETGELGITGGGELTAGGTDLLLLGGEAIGLRLSGLQRRARRRRCAPNPPARERDRRSAL